MKFISGFNLCECVENAWGVLERLCNPDTLAYVYDAETTGLDWRKDVIVGHVFTFGPHPNDTYYVPVRHLNEPAINYESGNIGTLGQVGDFEAALGGILADRRDLHMVGHNLIYDLMMLFRHRIVPVGTTEDTSVNAALLDEYARSYSLDSCCTRMGTTAKKGDALYAHMAAKFGGVADRNQMGSYWKLRGDDAMAVEYACGDGVATWNLWDAQVKALDKQGLDGMRRLESRVTRVVSRMMRRGTRIDRPRLSEIRLLAQETIGRARDKLPPDFNVLASSQIKKYLVDNGVTDFPMTAPSKTFPNGQPQFNEKFLATNEPGRNIIAVRKYEHLMDSFISPLIERHVWNDGRVRATFNQARSDEFGTVTGRFSCNEPNLQQIHKRNKEIGNIIRSAFISEPGHWWLDADLSQCEPRLLAHYSGSKVLLRGYNTVPFIDAHQAVADAATIDRETGKRLNQTLITGGGKGKIIQMLGSEGGKIYDKYFEAMPEVKKLQQDAARKMETRGHLVSLLKRHARMESRDKSYKAMNRILQCGNADIVKLAMVRIDEHFESGGDFLSILNTVHDSLSFDVPDDDDARREAETALRYFTDFGPGRSVEMRVPMAADYAYGENWAVATYSKNRETIGADPADPWYPLNKVELSELW